MKATLALALAAAGLVGCDSRDLQSRSEILEYRVLAIRADIPEPSPDDTATLTVVEHDPADVDPEAETGSPFYVWEICPFSLGSLAQYDCLDPLQATGAGPDGSAPTPEQQQAAGRVIATLAELGVSPQEAAGLFAPDIRQTAEGTITIDLETVGGVGIRGLYALCQAIASDGVCRSFEGQVVLLEEGWNLYVKLYSGREGVVRNDTVKVLKVRDFDGRNRANPAFATLEAFDASGAAVTGGVPEQKLTLKLTMVGGSAETYPAIQYDDNGQPVRDADGALVTEEETEELLYSWYATGGNIDRSRTVTDDLFDQRENEFTLPEEPGPVRLYVIARDGRGGFAVRSLDLQVSEP
ncbi:MAG: hypothetical protein KC549_17585 [Myxococcales bacterium]|nr:hypothetical protein [Myxococcales bacterium]MCB9547215.1 hypothetical protein [Myxococcales bacterium]